MIIMWKKLIIGLIAGIISGFFSAGGGLILVPSFVYFLNNFIHWNIGIKCAIGGVIGGIIGAKILTKIPNKYLKIIFALFLVYAGINMIIK